MQGVTLIKFTPSPTATRLLGEVTIEWSQLEFAIQMLIGMLSVEDRRLSEVFTYRAGMEKWLGWLEHLIALRYQSDVAAMADWADTLAAIKDAQTRRNDLVHSLMNSPVKWPIRARRTVSRGKKGGKRIDVEVQEVSNAYLRATIEAIHHAHEMLLGWEHEYLWPMGSGGPVPPPLPPDD